LEEKALVEYLLRMSNNGIPVPIEYLRSLALIIVRQCSSAFQAPTTDETIRPPGKNWPQGFNKHHAELKAKRIKALD
jgi:Tc5 transposase DNA-binding domain